MIIMAEPKENFLRFTLLNDSNNYDYSGKTYLFVERVFFSLFPSSKTDWLALERDVIRPVGTDPLLSNNNNDYSHHL